MIITNLSNKYLSRNTAWCCKDLPKRRTEYQKEKGDSEINFNWKVLGTRQRGADPETCQGRVY